MAALRAKTYGKLTFFVQIIQHLQFIRIARFKVILFWYFPVLHFGRFGQEIERSSTECLYPSLRHIAIKTPAKVTSHVVIYPGFHGSYGTLASHSDVFFFNYCLFALLFVSIQGPDLFTCLLPPIPFVACKGSVTSCVKRQLFKIYFKRSRDKMTSLVYRNFQFSSYTI